MKILYRYPAYKGKMYKICKIKEASGSVYFAADAAGKRFLPSGVNAPDGQGRTLRANFVGKIYGKGIDISPFCCYNEIIN